MKKIIVIASAVLMMALLLAACGNSGKATPDSATPDSAVSSTEKETTKVIETTAHGGTVEKDKEGNVIEKDKDLVEEIGFFDADYWVMGQDFDEENLHATDFVLEKLLLDDTPWRAVVTLKLQNYGTKPVRVDLVMEDGVWKVDDLTDLSYDLDWKKSMKEYLEE